MIVRALCLHAWALGFGVITSIPPGPTSALIIQRTLRAGRPDGVAALLGALLGEVLYLVGFVLGADRFLANGIMRHVTAGAGAIVLIVLAVTSYRRADRLDDDSPHSDRRDSRWSAARDAFVSTATNPAMALIVGGLAAGAGATFGTALVGRHLVTMAVAMEIGVVCWFTALIAVVARARHSQRVRRWQSRIVRVTAAMLAAFAVHLVVATFVGTGA